MLCGYTLSGEYVFLPWEREFLKQVMVSCHPAPAPADPELHGRVGVAVMPAAGSSFISALSTACPVESGRRWPPCPHCPGPILRGRGMATLGVRQWEVSPMGWRVPTSGPLLVLFLLPERPPPTCSAEQNLTDPGKPSSRRLKAPRSVKPFPSPSGLRDVHPLAGEHFTRSRLGDTGDDSGRRVALSPFDVWRDRGSAGTDHTAGKRRCLRLRPQIPGELHCDCCTFCVTLRVLSPLLSLVTTHLTITRKDRLFCSFLLHTYLCRSLAPVGWRHSCLPLAQQEMEMQPRRRVVFWGPSWGYCPWLALSFACEPSSPRTWEPLRDLWVCVPSLSLCPQAARGDVDAPCGITAYWVACLWEKKAETWGGEERYPVCVPDTCSQGPRN